MISCEKTVKGVITIFLLTSCSLLAAYMIYARILGITKTFDCLTEVTFALLAVINTIIYLRKDLYDVRVIFNKKNFTHVGMVLVMLSGLSIPVFYVVRVYPALANVGYDLIMSYNATRFNPSLFFAGELTYDILVPFFSVMILVNNVIFMRRILDFCKEVKYVQRYLQGLLTDKSEADCFSTETLKDIESKIIHLCDTNDELDVLFNMSMLTMVGIVPVRIFNIAGYVVTNPLEPDDTALQVLHFLNAVFSFVMSCEVSNKADNRKVTTVRTLTQLTMKGTYLKDQRFSVTVREIRTLIEENDFAVSVYGFFNLDRELIVAMVGILLTYCILIYQFAKVL